MVEGLLGRLRHHLVYMSDLAERQVDTAVMALIDGSPDLARQVLDAEEEMNALDLQVSRIAHEILTKVHPDGENFRFTIAGMRAASCLQRVGDVASDTAFQAQRVGKNVCIHDVAALESLVEIAESMVRDAVGALVSGNAETAWAVVRRADEVESQINDTIEACENSIPPDSPGFLHMIIAVLDLKRISEHAVSIAEEVIFMVEGRLVRHVSRHLLKGVPEPRVDI
ncbi:MAG: hypothetical protein JW909_07390 [Planctomycetes bacterium]|nr:hypothetical protein [Planctomycetota bacterium]